jgi:hypothetical protein
VYLIEKGGGGKELELIVVGTVTLLFVSADLKL